MSQIYSTEPATTGHVVFETTHGPIDIHLWCKECPSTTRTFLQLCLDGYYDEMLFHRILSDFLIQTGLTRDESMAGTSVEELDGYLRKSTAVPTESSSSLTGDALGWERKKLELNPRIRFNHRGQVAMAFPFEKNAEHNEEEKDALRYQFFIILDESPFLDSKHVIFGTVAGPTIFNALRIGRTEADESSGCPVDLKDNPPRIKKVKIDFHPFDDLVATKPKLIPWKRMASEETTFEGRGVVRSATEKRKKKRKGKRALNVLSFGDEEREHDTIVGGYDEDNGERGCGGGSMLSSHDVLANESAFLSSKADAGIEKRSMEKGEPPKEKKSDEKSKMRNETDPLLNSQQKDENTKDNAEQLQSSLNRPDHSLVETALSSKPEQNSKRKEKANSKSDGEVEARRYKYLKYGNASLSNKKEKLRRENDTMARFLAFKNKVSETKGPKSNLYGEMKPEQSKQKTCDNSLASRMAKRVEDALVEENQQIARKEALAQAPGYEGQLLDDEKSSDGTTDDRNWMGITFKCKRHIDHDSRKAAFDKLKDIEAKNDVGGDGRNVDDYIIIDEKCRSGEGGKGIRYEKKR